MRNVLLDIHCYELLRCLCPELVDICVAFVVVTQIIGYIGDVSTFLHQAYDNALSIRPEQEAVQFKVQIVRQRESSTTYLGEEGRGVDPKPRLHAECSITL